MTAPSLIRPTIPLPTRDTLADNEVVIAVTSRPDSFNRVSFYAFWRDDYLPPDGVRGQAFHTRLADFVDRERRKGRTVRGFDDATRRMLAAL